MAVKIPFFSLARQWKNHQHTLQSAVSTVLESQQFIGGQYVSQFEKDLAAYVGAQHAVACNSGTDALWMALKALNVTTNSIVLTTPFSFIASASEIVDLGGHAVFIDVEPDTYNMDPILLEQWLNTHAFMRKEQAVEKRTGLPIEGLVVVNLFGQCANYEKIKALADAWNLWIVEDACQSIGAHIGSHKAGTLGDIAAFSFYPTKNLGAFGDGGAVTTNDPYLAEKIMQLRNHGRKTHYEYLSSGINSRLDGLQANLLSSKLPLLDSWNNRRRAIAAEYTRQLSGLPGVTVPAEKVGHHVYHQYSMTVELSHIDSSRDLLAQELAARGVESRVFYPKPLHNIDFLNTQPTLVTSCPVAERLAGTIMALPLWPEMTDDEVATVCQAVIETVLSLSPAQRTATYHATV